MKIRAPKRVHQSGAFTPEIHWRHYAENAVEVFKAFFQRKESVQESFFRLRPLRVSAMHSRYLTQDDCAFLAVEIRRLKMAITSPIEFPEDDDADEV